MTSLKEKNAKVPHKVTALIPIHRLPSNESDSPRGSTAQIVLSRLGGRLGTSETLPVTLLPIQLDLENAMDVGPLKGIVSLLQLMWIDVQHIRTNIQSCTRLVHRASTFALDIRDMMEGNVNVLPTSIEEAVDQFQLLLQNISDWMHGLLKASLFTRIFKQSRIKDNIMEFEMQLADTISLFQKSALIELEPTMTGPPHITVSRGSVLEKQEQSQLPRMMIRSEPESPGDGFPLVHRSEVIMHGTVSVGTGWWHGLSEASINGRPVLIKQYRGKTAKKRNQEDITFLKSVWDARFPQLYGVSHFDETSPPFVVLHDVGVTDLRAFVRPFLEQGQLLEVAAIVTRVAEHLRAGLTMLASSGRWPDIYDHSQMPSMAMLSSLVINNRGNLVIGGDIASDRGLVNHRGPLVWLCHEVFGSRYPSAVLGVNEDDDKRRARQLANQIGGSIILSGTESPAQVSETLLRDLRDAEWTPAILRELRASMASWGLDDRGGLFSHCAYGDVGYLVENQDTAERKTFVRLGNIGNQLGPMRTGLLGADEPFRRRRVQGHVFEGDFELMIGEEVSATHDVVRFTFHKPRSIAYEHQFSVHEKPKDDPSRKTLRWRNIVSHVTWLAQDSSVPPEKLILVTGHRTTAMILAKYELPYDQPTPDEVHLFLSYSNYPMSYWSYDDAYKPLDQRKAIAGQGTFLESTHLSERRGFYIQFIPDDFN